MLPDNSTNQADLILDNCIQQLLYMKDNESLDINSFQIVLIEMMNELKDNLQIKNISPIIDSSDSS